jgi:hypothetical protein
MRAGSGNRFALAAAAMCASMLALADESALTESAAVPEAALEGLRGGFDIPANLHASLQLERVVAANGEQIAHLSADIPDVGHMTVAEAEALAHAAGTLVIQGGPNNAFNLMELGPTATVIQNTLNDQHLVAVTTLNVQVNSLAAFREMAFQDGLRDGIGSLTGVR